MSEPILFTMTKRLANGNVATIPLTARQSALILILLDFHDGEFDAEPDDAPTRSRPSTRLRCCGNTSPRCPDWDPAEKLDWPVVFVFTWANLSA